MPNTDVPGDREYTYVEDRVNRTPNGATEPDEEKILAALYGPADKDGFYRGATDGDG